MGARSMRNRRTSGPVGGRDRAGWSTRRRAGALVLAATATVAAACAPPTTAPPTTLPPDVPSDGRFISQLYSDSQLTSLTNQVYGTAVDASGATVDLGLDVYLPPVDGPDERPVVIVVHGGGFTSGTRQQMAGTARSYARRGFVAATISYRLDPLAHQSEQRYLATATNAIDDGIESVRWIRANAALLGADAERIAVVGSSAGGAVALGTSMVDDPTPGGPLAAYSAEVQAAVSTGATLTPGIETGLVTFESTDAPSLMFHHQVDTVTGFTDVYSKVTCDGLVNAGSSCTFVTQSGSGHTVPIGAGGTYWADIAPFLWRNLDLVAVS